MKITAVEPFPVACEGYGFALIVVAVRTDEGLTGIGEASLAGHGRSVLGALDHFAELLVGRDPLQIERIWTELVRDTFWSNGQVIMSAVAGIDAALWDIKGKTLGVPVYELLGGPTRKRVRVYRHLAGLTAPELLESAQRWVEQGFTALRFPPLGAREPRDIANWDPQRAIVATIAGAELLRGTLGESVDLILDAHTMFTPAEAAYLGHALEPVRLFFLEDPIRPLNPRSLRHVRDHVNLPLATGEQLAHKWEFRPVIEEELVDYLRVDVAHSGGITEAKKILAMAEAHGQRSALHHYSSPLNGAACLHVDLAVPNFGIQEWMELPGLDAVFPNAPRAHAGYVEPPRGPGLGLDFDEAEARKRPSRDAPLPRRTWPDGSHADF